MLISDFARQRVHDTCHQQRITVTPSPAVRELAAALLGTMQPNRTHSATQQAEPS